LQNCWGMGREVNLDAINVRIKNCYEKMGKGGGKWPAHITVKCDPEGGPPGNFKGKKGEETRRNQLRERRPRKYDQVARGPRDITAGA